MGLPGRVGESFVGWERGRSCKSGPSAADCGVSPAKWEASVCHANSSSTGRVHCGATGGIGKDSVRFSTSLRSGWDACMHACRGSRQPFVKLACSRGMLGVVIGCCVADERFPWSFGCFCWCPGARWAKVFFWGADGVGRSEACVENQYLLYNKVLPVLVFMASMLHRPGGFLCREKHGSRSIKTKWHARTVGVKKP